MTDGDRFKIGAGIIILVLFIWGIYGIITYRQVEVATVAHLGWDTQIDVLQYQTVHDGGWSVPSDGRETNHYRKQRSTETYVSGYRTVTKRGSCTTTGSGKNQRRSCSPDTTVREAIYSTRPIYDTYYEYDIDRWVNIQPLRAAGNQDINRKANKDDHYWYMPDTTDGDYNDNPVIGNKKLGLQRTHFFIIFQGKDKQYPVDMPVERWTTHQMNERYDITLGWFGNIIEVKKTGSW